MKTCDDYQLDLERRRRGASSPTDAEEATRHLSACLGCQQAEALATRTDALLSASAAAATPEVDWNRVARRIDRELRAYRALPWVVLVTFVLIGFGLGGAFSPHRWLRTGIHVSAMGALLAAACALYATRKLRPAQRATALGGEELLVYRRREADAQLREARRIWLAGPLLVVPSAVGAVLGWDNEFQAGPALALVALLGAAATVHTLTVELPRLRRERAELS